MTDHDTEYEPSPAELEEEREAEYLSDLEDRWTDERAGG